MAEDKEPKGFGFPAPLGTAGKADDAPKRGPGRPKGSTNKSSGSMSVNAIEKAIADQFTMIGVAVTAFNEYDGTVILQGTPRLAKSIGSLCEKNPKVRKNIERMLTGGSYGEVLLAGAFIAVPIMANHGLMPESVQAMYGRAIPEKPDPVEPREPVTQHG